MKIETRGIIGDLEYRKPQVQALYWVLFAFLILVAAVCLIPIMWVILSSFKDIDEFYSIPPTIFPKTFHLNKLWTAWHFLNFTKLYLNTSFMMIGNLVFAILFNGLAGYVFSKLKPIGSSFILLLILWTMLFSNSAMVEVFKNIISFPLIHISLMNSFLPIWMMAGANSIFIIVFKGFFDKIPQSLIEAARIDGCTHIGIFTKIVVPLSLPIITAVGILVVNATWSDFFWPFMILKEAHLWTVMVSLFVNKGTTTMDQEFIMLSFTIVPPAILFIVFQNFIMQGFTHSGIKG
jgi:multiple sugar transport system permease protein